MSDTISTKIIDRIRKLAALEAEGRAAARNAKYEELKAQGVEDDEAWYIASGYTPERAKELVAYWKKQAEKDAENSRRRSGTYNYRYTERERREDEKRASSSFRAGASAGGNIGLDPQIDKKDTKKIK